MTLAWSGIITKNYGYLLRKDPSQGASELFFVMSSNSKV